MTEKPNDKKLDIEQEEEEKQYSFKLMITHTKVKGIEKACNDVIKKIRKLEDVNSKLKHSGPARMPTKNLKVVTRKSPCGNGTNTYDNWEMRIHKRVFYITSSQKEFSNVITGLYSEPGMILEAEQITGDEDED